MGISEWITHELCKEQVKQCALEWNVSMLAAAVLCSRGIYPGSGAYKFFDKCDRRENPFELTDMDKLVKRIKAAIKYKEKICVYGDYDADGITATALVYSHLKSKEANVLYYIPERDKDGYGLNIAVIDELKSRGVDLIFTVDNGISAFDEVKYANSCGIDIVITDHHRVHGCVPSAAAVVDPYREECENLKHKNFAGVGVALKVIEALEEHHVSFDELLEKYCDLVTIGTIGDSIELVGETKEIVKRGVKSIANSKNPGVQALLKCAGLFGKEIDSTSVAFGLVPRINACGRMGNAELALEILLCDDDLCAQKFGEELNKLNLLRKETEKVILESVESLLTAEPHRKYEKVIIAEGNNWNHGVLGIVASKISQKYGKPCILITIEGETSRGSCRSVEGFSIYELLSLCSKLLIRFGGHPMAAGFSIDTRSILDFRNLVKDLSGDFEVLPSKTIVDVKLNPSKVNSGMPDDLEVLRPFGNGNPEPIFGFFNMTLKKIKPIGGGKHLKLTFRRGDTFLDVLYFNKSLDQFLYQEGEVLDIAANIYKNEYKGITTLSVCTVDLKLSSVDSKKAAKDKMIYEKFKREYNSKCREFEPFKPNKEDFSAFYRYLRLICNRPTRADIINERLFGGRENLFKIYIMFDAMEEIGLIGIIRNGDEYKVKINSITEKVRFEDSMVLKSAFGSE